ncbi:hypothetical protein PHYSODRAFT_306166 [Phytophthora sojae]|uniref:Uncharacterized protein n=1 Tax=Phytophthora sojae (strain P6497) TaxID=1094619 RepID=G5A865_PHYSP|nr:hypothetical protein PHYSODRAFT_306166 [Phytophthora sojae]EGZ08091.1 hypothetical protein PHYSODRAFT_306166 [Phytophthora sojae]|eukprot:XP_009536263.1 hypothetical protein PHYSODRAFT_306166 [Phytophthora sojae]
MSENEGQRGETEASKFPDITCGCKRPRCPVTGCWKCSRCGCSCDGLSPSVKRARTRGRPLAAVALEGCERALSVSSVDPAISVAKRSTRQKSQRVRNVLIDDGSDCGDVDISPPVNLSAESDVSDCGAMDILSPVSVGAGPAASAGLRAQNEAGMYLSPAIFTPTPKARKRVDIFAVMQFLVCEETQINMMKKKLPSKERRCSESFWSSSACGTGNDPRQQESQNAFGDQPRIEREHQERAVALRLVWNLLSHICTILCRKQTASVFLELFRSWISPGQISTISTIATPVRVFMATKRGSGERWCVRALLCDAFPLSTLTNTAEQIEEFSFGRKNYMAGQKDL